jgi:fused signal recognition particle receptor
MSADTTEHPPAGPNAAWSNRLKKGLVLSSVRLTGGIGRVFGQGRLTDEALEELEELLISADLGVATATKLTETLARARFGKDVTSELVCETLADEITAILAPVARTITVNPAYRPHVMLFCGVNGSGKTTSIAKFGHLFRQAGLKVLIAACDTFRAAAIEQLQIWGDRAGCPVLTRPIGSDPASLAFDAFQLARAERADVLMIDTAGRLQNKTHLMDELQKIIRVLRRFDENAPHDGILVLDATVGQNAHSQVDVFRGIVNVTGLVVTKLDGSAKGGVVVALAERVGLPIYGIGVGETMEDFRAFDAGTFARGLLGLDA